MRIFLRYVGDPGFQIGVAYDVGIAQNTVLETLWHAVTAKKSKAENWIRFPTTVTAVQTECKKKKCQERYLKKAA